MTNDVFFAIIRGMVHSILDHYELGPEHAPVAPLVAEHRPTPGEHARLIGDRSLAALGVNRVSLDDPTARAGAHAVYVAAHSAVVAYERQQSP